MNKIDGQYFYSPSDLTRFMESPFASWMDRYALECPNVAFEKDGSDPLLNTLKQRGITHEIEVEKYFIAQGFSVFKIDGQTNEEKYHLTLTSMREGFDVIVQARLEAGQLSGFSDFLMKVDGESSLGSYHYEAWDTKLACKMKPTFVIQLCCYSELLEAMQGRRPNNITVVLGNHEQRSFCVRDFFYYYLELKKSFLLSQSQFDLKVMPDPSDSKSWGDWSAFADKLLRENDHLFQVATITRSQIKKLHHIGIQTMQQLVDTKVQYVRGMNPSVFKRLKTQATVQKQSIGKHTPHFIIIPPEKGERSGLALLPQHSISDIFFDIEGYPLEEGGLEYLWGCVYYDENGQIAFRDFWAHNHEQEKKVFEDFIQWVYMRWQQDRTMHIYHYASYEIIACRKLMGRYGVCEYELDQLLRNEVFVDLYKIVKGCLILGEPSYSIKNVEHLYRGKRDTEVGSGSASVVVYEQWRTLHDKQVQGDNWQTSEILKSIRDYNMDDCNSTRELVDWLRKQQKDHGIAYLGKSDVVEPDIKEETTRRTELRDRLLKKAEQQSKKNLSQSALTKNLAWVLEFHRREAKPIFWRLFDRLGLSEEALLCDVDCLAYCVRTKKVPFKPTPRSRNLAYEYQFDATQEFKGAGKTFYLLGVEDENGSRVKATYLPKESDLENGLIVIQTKLEPPDRITLVPDEYINPEPIPQAIHQIVSDYESGELGRCAILEFLKRAKPAIKGHQGGPIAPSHVPSERLQQIIHAIQHLDRSYLTIQGPPGSGKSYTGKHVIAELVKNGHTIGISSNSHKAINHLLLNTAEYCHLHKINATFACTKETGPGLKTAGIHILKNSDLANTTVEGCILGTTAWGFAREDMKDQLDYLIVDEAGQVSVANLIAMSRCAKNLILMGDQMQLGQPSQGEHPAESGLSVLDYLLHDAPTIAADMGVFLSITYRMHSSVNQFISNHIYDGKLASHPDTDCRIVKMPEYYQGKLNRESGIIFVPVAHEGNTHASDEEVAEIKFLSYELIGRTFIMSPDQHREITWDDILFVAPYNYQVKKLKNSLGDQALVGSVDKFQGQEAPIVFLSMCASSASDSPRGIDFLFNKNRINVAISRAQSLVVVVCHPKISDISVSQVKHLKLLNLFNALQVESNLNASREKMLENDYA